MGSGGGKALRWPGGSARKQSQVHAEALGRPEDLGLTHLASAGPRPPEEAAGGGPAAAAAAAEEEEAARGADGGGVRTKGTAEGAGRGEEAAEAGQADLDFAPLTGGRRKCDIPRVEDRGICPFQLRSLLDFLALHTSAGSQWPHAEDDGDALRGRCDDRSGCSLRLRSMDFYQLVERVVKPCTRAERCSFVEAIAQDAAAQKPTWFVSHWWGEAVADFVLCVEAHKTLRRLPEATGYWVCACAGNQWRLAQEMLGDPGQAPYRRAMAACVGTLSVVDRDATAFSRVWCCHEVSIALGRSEGMLYDLATVAAAGKVAILSSGLTAEDEAEGELAEWQHAGGAAAAKVARERSFPIELMAKAMQAKLELGQASQPEDRRCILNATVGRTDLRAEPPERHSRYDEVNRVLRWRFALAFCEQAFDAGETDRLGLKDVEPPKDVDVDVCEKMASAFCGRAKYGLALAFYEKSLDICMKSLGPEHTSIAATYSNMALVYADQGQLDEALKFNQKSLDIKVKALGPEHTSVAATYNNMALLFKTQGQLDKAAEFYQQSLDIYMQTLGPEHTCVATIYNNMASVFADQGQLDKALETYQQSLDIKVKAMGPEHTSVAATSNNMALLFKAQGQLDKALKFNQKSLDIYVRAPRAEHASVARTYNNMASVFKAQGQLDQAVEFYQQSLDIAARALGPEHTCVAATYYNMASVFDAQGQSLRALECMEKAAAVYEACYGRDHPEAADARRRAEALQAQLA